MSDTASRPQLLEEPDMIINPYRFAGGGASYLLDDYGSALFAFSVRLLRSAYSGSLVKVRRSSDSVEADVDPDSSDEISLDSAVTITSGSSSATNLGELMAAGGYTDADSLGAADSALVTTWYDQSGNSNDMTQTTAANQPRLVNAGTLVTRNSKPAIEWVDASDGMEKTTTSGAWGGNGSTICFVMADANVGTLSYNIRGENYPRFPSNSSWRFDCGTLRTGGTEDASQHLHFAFMNNSTSDEYWLDGSSIISGASAGANTGSRIRIMDNCAAGAEGTHQELVCWVSDQTSNRSGIETNINSHFSIF